MSMTAVAKLAGVSQATVSRVFNHHNKVSEETRLKVEEAMKSVGYSLAKRRPQKTPTIRSVAILAFDDSLHQHGAFTMAMFLGVQEAAAKVGVSTFIGNATNESALLEWLDKINPDGVLLIGTSSRSGFEKCLSDIPYLWLTSHAKSGTDAVLPGNNAVGHLALDYLCELGCRNLAFISALPKNPSYRVRGDAFEREALVKGFKVRQLVSSRGSRIGSVPLNIAELEPRIDVLVNELLKISPLPDGLFVPSDYMTALVYRCLNKAGVAPGKKIKIISCDNEEPYLAGLFPRPATIDIAGEARGRKALHELLWRIDNPNEKVSMQLIVEPHLIVH